MANTPISDLPVAISLDGTEYLPIVQGGTTKRVTTAMVAAQTTPDLDTISSTQGTILYRSATAWTALSPGTSGYLLQTQGAGANPAWAPAGTVFSVAVSGGTTGLSVSGSPITTSGTITLSGTLAVANGGTGATTLTNHGVLLGHGTSAVAATSAGTSGHVLISGGASADPSFQSISSVLTAGDVTGALTYTPANRAGDTFTGNIVIDKEWPTLWIDADSGTSAYIFGVKNGLQRWLIEPGNNTAESGSDAGSDFVIHRYTDAGAWAAASFFIKRSTGKVGIGTTSPGQTLTVTGTIESTSGGIKFPDATTQTTAFVPHTGSTALETSLPIGHTIFVDTSSAVNKNSSTTLYAGSTDSDSYNIAATGSALTGTWRSRGSIGGHTIYQRVA